MKEKQTPLKAIRAKCLDCCCGSSHEVKLCPSEECNLYPFRFGKNPFARKILSEEERARKRENFLSLIKGQHDGIESYR